MHRTLADAKLLRRFPHSGIGMDHEFGYFHRPFLDICLQTKHSSKYRLVMYMLWLGRIMYKLRNCYKGKRKSSLSRPSNNCIKMGERVSQQRSPENP